MRARQDQRRHNGRRIGLDRQLEDWRGEVEGRVAEHAVELTQMPALEWGIRQVDLLELASDEYL
jgi:hypothetical protein